MILKYIVLPLLFYSFWWRYVEGNEGNAKGNGNNIEDCGMNKAVKKVIVTRGESGDMKAVFICGEHVPKPIHKKCSKKKLRNGKCKNKSDDTYSTNKTSEGKQSCKWRRDACIVNDTRHEIARGGRCDDNSAVDIRCCYVSCITKCRTKNVEMEESYMTVELKKHEVISDFHMSKRPKRSGQTGSISYTICEDCSIVPPVVVVPVVVIGDGDTCPFPDLSMYDGNTRATILAGPPPLDASEKKPLEPGQTIIVICDDTNFEEYECVTPGPVQYDATVDSFSCPMP